MLGTWVNVGAVLAGTALGWGLRSRLPARLHEGARRAIGLFTLVLGIEMALQGPGPLLSLLSLVLGAWIGESLSLEQRLRRIARSPRAEGASVPHGGWLTAGITASLLFLVGPMTVVGALNDGLRGDPTLLFTKSVLDGLSAAALSAGLGPGVALAAASMLIYQGGLTLGAAWLEPLLSEPRIAALTGVGGLLVVGIGLELLGVATLPLVNYLPSLPIALLLAAGFWS